MSLKVISKQSKGAVAIDQIKTITGYLMGVRFTPAKKNKGGVVVRKASPIYVFQDKTTSERKELWGCATIDQNLLDGDSKSLDPILQGALVKIDYKGKQKIKGRSLPMKVTVVQADIDDRIDVDTIARASMKDKIAKARAAAKAK